MASAPSRKLDRQPIWYQRLRDPAIGNICAFFALLVAVAAGIGLLRQGIFWLIVSYSLLIGALLVLVAIARHTGRRVRALDADLSTSRLEAEELKKQVASTQEELAFAREEYEAAEGGYASLRDAVIHTARSGGPELEDFDDELGHALLELRGQRDPAPRAAR